MNRNILLTLTLFFCLSAVAQSDETISLKDAIKQKKIIISGEYNDNSVHYLRPVVLTIISLVALPFRLKIESGDYMEPQDSGCQTMMITGDTTFVVNSGQKTRIEPYGMCTEPLDKAGSEGLKYFFETNKNTQLIAIAQYINKNKLNDFPGQEAVWCVADEGRSLLDINGYDTATRSKLIAKVAAITGKKMPNKQELQQGYETYVQIPTETIEFSFEYKSSKSRKIHIALFNSQGTVVRELYYNANELPGVHKVDYEFDYTIYTDEYYDIKLIADDEVLLTSRVNKNYEDWEEE